jgi:hypothetical protein
MPGARAGRRCRSRDPPHVTGVGVSIDARLLDDLALVMPGWPATLSVAELAIAPFRQVEGASPQQMRARGLSSVRHELRQCEAAGAEVRSARRCACLPTSHGLAAPASAHSRAPRVGGPPGGVYFAANESPTSHGGKRVRGRFPPGSRACNTRSRMAPCPRIIPRIRRPAGRPSMAVIAPARGRRRGRLPRKRSSEKHRSRACPSRFRGALESSSGSVLSPGGRRIAVRSGAAHILWVSPVSELVRLWCVKRRG